MQSATAFGTIHNALSFFRERLRRVRELPRRGDPPRRAGRGERAPAQFSQVTTATRPTAPCRSTVSRCAPPTARISLRALDFRLDPGDTLLVSGPSGIGKTVLLQSLAGLWPFVSGSVRLPGGRQAAMFVPQLPYLPLGDLRAVASYPNEEGVVDDREIQQALIKVALPAPGHPAQRRRRLGARCSRSASSSGSPSPASC